MSNVSPAAIRAAKNSPWPTEVSPGTKYDQGKVPISLLDRKALEGVAAVLAFGAKKYAAHNWRGGISYNRLLDAMGRHYLAIVDGEDVDPESGLPHIDHLGCCWMFLSHAMKNKTGRFVDDRYKEPVAQVQKEVERRLKELENAKSNS